MILKVLKNDLPFNSFGHKFRTNLSPKNFLKTIEKDYLKDMSIISKYKKNYSFGLHKKNTAHINEIKPLIHASIKYQAMGSCSFDPLYASNFFIPVRTVL